MATSFPLAVTNFLSIATAALPATSATTNVVIKFGSIIGVNPGMQWLLVKGCRYTEDTWGELGPTYRHEEHYYLACEIGSSAGSDDEATRMTEVQGLYNDVAIAVANNPTLNGAVRVSECRQLSYSPSYTPQGFSQGCIEFELYCEQRVNSLT